MSGDHDAMGKTTAEYLENRKHLASVRKTLADLGKALAELGDALQTRPANVSVVDGEVLLKKTTRVIVHITIQAIPPLDIPELAALLHELHTIHEEQSRLESTLRQMGLEKLIDDSP